MEKVSVIIPTFNRKELVLRAVRSVLAQTYQNLEVFVIDDGSSDGTGEAFRTGISDARAHYVFQENKGVAAARNHGLQLASVEGYVAFLDSDDWWFPEKIRAQVAMAKKIGGSIFLMCNGISGQKPVWSRGIPSGYLLTSPEDDPLSIVQPAPSSWFFSKDVFLRAGNFDEDFKIYEDQDFMMRLFEARIPCYYMSDILVEWGSPEDHLFKLSPEVVFFKERFLAKRSLFFKEHKRRHYLFLQVLCRDSMHLKNRKAALRFLRRAFDVCPWKFKNVSRFFKTMFLRV